jgi:hypothetical protein
MIVVISTGTLASSVVIAVQKRGRLGERLSLHAIRITKIFAFISITDTPLHLRPGTRVSFCKWFLNVFKRFLFALNPTQGWTIFNLPNRQKFTEQLNRRIID